MLALRLFLLAIFAIAGIAGCQGKPDTDPSDKDLEVPTVDSGEK